MVGILCMGEVMIKLLELEVDYEDLWCIDYVEYLVVCYIDVLIVIMGEVNLFKVYKNC